ncbi:prepilin peptidase [Butyrivibrio sp. XPD2006]|uniref:prepilin peptidase n=1 Tax=Butyrivibrio sp. XPD2006 TaxID=1280668 RepID=UPI0003B4C28D|nr:prepilin peptidase [Butyrivibrio sp. XPD2006]
MFFGIGVLLIMIISSIGDIRSREVLLWEILGCLGMSFARVALSIYGNSFDASDILMSLMPGAFLLLLAYVSGHGVGYGDGLLLIAAGPALGSNITVMGMIAGIFACGIVSGFLLVFKKVGRKARMPFVPFMTFGLGVMMLAQV